MSDPYSQNHSQPTPSIPRRSRAVTPAPSPTRGLALTPPAPTRPRRRPCPVEPRPPCRATASSPAGKRVTCHCHCQALFLPRHQASRTAPTLHTPGGAGDPCGCGLGASAVRGPSLWVTDYRSLGRSTGGPRTVATRSSLGGGAARTRRRVGDTRQHVKREGRGLPFCCAVLLQPAGGSAPASPRPPRSPGSAPTLASSSQAGTGTCRSGREQPFLLRLNRCHLLTGAGPF
jgi:hypothetical protein